MAYPLRIPKLHTVYHRASYSGPYSSPCTQTIYLKQLTLQRRSCMPNDTTTYCVGESVDRVATKLNKALEKLALWWWCVCVSVCEEMILKRNHFIGPLGSLKINQHLIQ